MLLCYRAVADVLVDAGRVCVRLRASFPSLPPASAWFEFDLSTKLMCIWSFCLSLLLLEQWSFYSPSHSTCLCPFCLGIFDGFLRCASSFPTLWLRTGRDPAAEGEAGAAAFSCVSRCFSLATALWLPFPGPPVTSTRPCAAQSVYMFVCGRVDALTNLYAPQTHLNTVCGHTRVYTRVSHTHWSDWRLRSAGEDACRCVSRRLTFSFFCLSRT